MYVRKNSQLDCETMGSNSFKRAITVDCVKNAHSETSLNMYLYNWSYYGLLYQLLMC